MRKRCPLSALYLMVICLTGCARPDHVTRVQSPIDGVFYTVETFNGYGAVGSNFTRVYAHLERDGKSDKQLVVDGTYLEFSKISWGGSHDVTLCMQAGITDSFRSEVTLIAGDASESIHNHLQENCSATTTASPSGSGR